MSKNRKTLNEFDDEAPFDERVSLELSFTLTTAGVFANIIGLLDGFAFTTKLLVVPS